MEDANLIHNRITMLERALIILRLDDTTSSSSSSDQVDDPEDSTEDDGEDDDDSEDDLAMRLVKSGVAKKILGWDVVTPGAA